MPQSSLWRITNQIFVIISNKQSQETNHLIFFNHLYQGNRIVTARPFISPLLLSIISNKGCYKIDTKELYSRIISCTHKASLLQFLQFQSNNLLQYLRVQIKKSMGCCYNSNEEASPVVLPHPQTAPIKGESLALGDAKVVKLKDQQNQSMAAISKQLSQQNEPIVKLQIEKEKQNLPQEQRLQQMKNQMKQQRMKQNQEERKQQQLLIDQMELEKQKLQQEKRRLQKPKIEIPIKYKNIGKGVLTKSPIICASCSNYLPKFIDYQLGLKKCVCGGLGINLNQKKGLECQNCRQMKPHVYVAEICFECYGYGVLNQ